MPHCVKDLGSNLIVAVVYQDVYDIYDTDIVKTGYNKWQVVRFRSVHIKVVVKYWFLCDVCFRFLVIYRTWLSWLWTCS